MRALVCDQYGPLEALEIRAFEAPPLQPGTVRIRVMAASVNPPDVLMPQGKYQVKPPLPFVPGVEGMGRVIEVADDVVGFAIGDRVMSYAGWGCFAEEVVVPAIRVQKVPSGMSDREASGFVLVYSTAYHGMVDCGQLKAGEVVVVLGASGGIGLCAIQVAKALGARVIAVASTEEKLARCRAHGADEGINSSDQDVTARIRQLTADQGAEVVLDVVGGDLTEKALRAVRPYGRLLIAGYASGVIPLIKGNLVLLKQAQVIGVSYRLFLERTPHLAAANLQQLCELWCAGKLHPEVSAEFPFERVLEAIGKVANREAIGKIAVVFPTFPVGDDRAAISGGQPKST